MTSARSRRSSLAHQSLSASLKTTDNILTTTTLPGLLTKSPGLSPYLRPLDSVPSNLIDKLRQTAQHYGQQVKKLHTSKVKHTQTEQSERRENRYQTHNNESRNEYSHIQSISTGYAKITRYSMSKKGMNNKLNTEHRKRKLK